MEENNNILPEENRAEETPTNTVENAEQSVGEVGQGIETPKGEENAVNQAPFNQAMSNQPPFYPNQQFNYMPPSIPEIKYSKPTAEEKGKGNKGLRVFCIILAFIVVFTGACSIGYLFGVRGLNGNEQKHSEIELAARPKTGEELTEAQVFENVNESIVGIRVYNDQENYSDCSGVVYSNDGYIVSNDHIYSEIPEAKFKIYTFDGKEYDAKYVAGDQISDLTILKVEGANLKAATFGDSDELFCGEHVVAIGRPSNAKGGSSITSGIVSLPKRRVKTTTNYSSNLIETDSAINPGSSGGALVDMYGHVIGITSSKLAGMYYDSVCFAIPSRTVKKVCEELIKEGKVVSRAKLGITYQEIDSVAAEIKGESTTGLYIASVSSESDLYGKAEEGDIITQINGEKITSDTVVLDIIENSSAGDTVTVTIKKKSGNTAEYTVKLLANTGTSSYKTYEEYEKENSEEDEQQIETPEDPENKSFDFPFGD